MAEATVGEPPPPPPVDPAPPRKSRALTIVLVVLGVLVALPVLVCVIGLALFLPAGHDQPVQQSPAVVDSVEQAPSR